MVSLNKYMEINGLSHELKRKARKYINYIYTRSNNRLDLKELLGVLSQPLREEIYSHINGSAVLTLKFLKEVPKSCISRISRFLKPEVNSPNEMIFVENEESVYMRTSDDDFINNTRSANPIFDSIFAKHSKLRIRPGLFYNLNFFNRHHSNSEHRNLHTRRI